jgi:hypothetical protein
MGGEKYNESDLISKVDERRWNPSCRSLESLDIELKIPVVDPMRGATDLGRNGKIGSVSGVSLTKTPIPEKSSPLSSRMPRSKLNKLPRMAFAWFVDSITCIVTSAKSPP